MLLITSKPVEVRGFMSSPWNNKESGRSGTSYKMKYEDENLVTRFLKLKPEEYAELKGSLDRGTLVYLEMELNQYEKLEYRNHKIIENIGKKGA